MSSYPSNLLESQTPPISTRSLLVRDFPGRPQRENGPSAVTRFPDFDASGGTNNLFSLQRPSFLDQIRLGNQSDAEPLITVLSSQPNTSEDTAPTRTSSLFPTIRRLLTLNHSQQAQQSANATLVFTSGNPNSGLGRVNAPFRPPGRRNPNGDSDTARRPGQNDELSHFDIPPTRGVAPLSLGNFNSSAVRRSQVTPASLHPSFRSKTVVKLDCRYCGSLLCKRGMKAILLANVRVELYSTDTVPTNVQLVNDNYATTNCMCKIRDVACLGCGNVVGYHVTAPCQVCMSSNNNGHFYMFFDEGVIGNDRVDPKTKRSLYWGHLAYMDDPELVGDKIEHVCR